MSAGSPRIRLFPVVAAAAAALLLLKGAELALAPAPPKGQAYRPAFAEGFTKVRGNLDLDPVTTGSTPPKKEEKADAKDEKKPDDKKAAEKAAPVGQPVQLDRPAQSPGEKALLERLGERREALEDRQRELETRENLLKAADKKLEARINELRELEAKQKEGGGPDKPGGSEQQALKNLVTMYETMKPKEAARVFDKLDMKVLVPVVNGMNPRKMAEILAAMSPEAAGRLTVELAHQGQKPQAGPAPVALPAGELPAIEPPRRQ